MKRFAAMFVAILSLVLMGQGIALAGASIDQEYYKAGDGSLAIKPQAIAVQSFRPSMSNLDKVQINLTNTKGTGSCGYDKYNGSDWDPVKYINNQALVDGWNTFDFEDKDVTVGARYRIWFQASDNDTQWYYGTANPYGPYPNGSASWGPGYTSHPDTDFQFRTWGTNPVEILAENTQPTDQGSSATGTGGTTTATTTSSIAKPTELRASYDTAAQLTWKASATSDITGYYVFRSEASGKNYVKIGQTEKNVLQYADQSGVASTTYYYVVRAYKGTGQSLASNEASLVIPATAAPIAPQNLSVIIYGSSYIRVIWDKNPESDIAEYSLTLSQDGTVISTAAVTSDVTTFLFDQLTPNTLYTISMTAKSTDDKISAPSEVAQQTALTETVSAQKLLEMTSALWAFLGLALVLIVVLIYVDKKRRGMTK